MTEIGIGVTANYEYRPDADEPYTAVVRVELPMNDQNALPPVIRSADYKVCGESLHAYWGSAVEGALARARTTMVSGNTFEEVVDLVCATRDEVIATMREVAAHNMAMARTTPEEE